MSCSERKSTAYAVLVASALLGQGSLLLFLVFLFTGAFRIVDLGLDARGALQFNALLSVIFFLQHSIMVRQSARRRLAKLVPDEYVAALYAICSSLALLVVVLLWQHSGQTVVEVHGICRAPFRTIFALSLAGFVWGSKTLRGFDPFGLGSIRRELRGTKPKSSRFIVAGPYRWVRHPLYLCAILMIWSCPDLTTDRLLFNLLWTAWIVAGTLLEERDLVAEFGDSYRAYQSRVPMLVPHSLRPRAQETNCSTVDSERR